MALLTLDAGHNLVGLLGHLLVNILSLLVILVDVLGFLQGNAEILLHQQVHRFLTILHTSGGIDARTDLEHDITHGDIPAVQSADINNSLQTDTRVLVQLLQSVEGENAVLVSHGHDISSDGHCHEVE